MSAKNMVAKVSSAKIGVKAFNPSEYVNENLNEEDVMKIKQIFDVFDSDHSGSISPKEMQQAIRRLNMEIEAQSIMDIIKDVDEDGDCEVNFKEFLKIFGFSASIDEEKTLDDLFHTFDEDNDGLISFDDFARISQKVGERYSDNELKEMIEYAGKEVPGKVTRQEFEIIVTKKYPKV